MISSKRFQADGSNTRFLSDFIIKSEQFCRVYNYLFDPNGIDGDIDPTTGLYIRIQDTPQSEDLVTIDKWDLVDNSISFYSPPFGRVYIEVATTPEEFGTTLIQPAVERALQAAEAAEVSELNAKASELNAKASEIASSSSEANASVSETNAANSETNAANSETSAKDSELNAKASEVASANSEVNASNSETNAATSAANASVSEANAANSETNAATSAANAAVSEANAEAYANSINPSELVRKDGTTAMEGSLDLNSNKIINLQDGTAVTDGVNKQQLDTKEDSLGLGAAGQVLATNTTEDGKEWVTIDSGLGSGQVWVDETANRDVDIVYTNNTGRSIAIAVEHTGSSSADDHFLYVDDKKVGYYYGASIIVTLFAIVPNGSTYYASNTSPNPSIATWLELK